MRIINSLKIVFALLCVQSAFSQNVSREEFERAIDYFNCEIVKLSLKSEADAFKKFNSNCDCKKYPSFTAIKSAIKIELGATIELTEDINKYKQEYKESIDKNQLKNIITDSINKSSKYDKIKGFYEKHSDDIGNLKDSLITTFESPEFWNYQTNSSTNTSVQTSENETNGNSSEEAGWFSGFSSQMLVMSIVVSLIFSIIFLLISKSMNRSFVENEIAKLWNKTKKVISDNPKDEEKKSKDSRRDNDHQTNQLTSDFQELKDQIKLLKKEVDELREKSNHSTQMVQKTVVSSGSSINSTAKASAKFFLFAPQEECKFEGTTNSTLISGKTFYEATEISTNEATFIFCNDNESATRALAKTDRYILTVCDVLNSMNNASRIVTETPGKIQLVDGSWKVIEKAKIRYES